MKENLIIIHGGGPTAVLNCSLYGAVREAQASGLVEHVYGAVGGTGGLLKEKLLDFGSVPEEELERLPTTPATAIGTSRDALEAEDYARMADILAEKHIRYVLMNGGNGTMDACGKLAAVCRDRGISVMGIPKTMDNDIAVTDHCPGFGSVARYMAGTVRELGVDVRSLPIHVVVLEALGRNAGWTTAAAALAREQEGDAPHLLYPPERPFHEDEFLDRVGDMYRKLGGVVVVASEGLHDDEGKPIVPPIFQTGRSTYFGDVSSHLAQLVVRRLGIKARSEKPGILARAAGGRGMVGGQVLDMAGEGRALGLTEVEELQRLKTGALIRAAVEMGCAVAGGAEEQREALCRYADCLGLAFQIQDDILDVVGDEATLGKPIGSDVRSDKTTFVALKGLADCRILVAELTDRAVEALAPFGSEAESLRGLAQSLAGREK